MYLFGKLICFISSSTTFSKKTLGFSEKTEFRISIQNVYSVFGNEALFLIFSLHEFPICEKKRLPYNFR